MTLLTPLRHALACEAWSEALVIALEAWRESRDPALVCAVVHASDKALSEFRGPTSRTREAFDRSWHVVSRRETAVATGWLAANLTTKVPEYDPDDGDFQRRGFARERHRALLRRVELLGARGADPRIARAALVVVQSGRLGAWDDQQTRDLYGPFLDLLVRAGDPSVLDALRQLRERPRSRRATVRSVLEADLPATIEALEQVPESADLPWSSLRSLVPRLDRPTPNASADVGELLASVREHPDDDELRTVLGDAWLEQGGPRAELVRLEREGVQPDDKRVRRVISRHAVGLMGEPLAAVLVRPIFRDGLLHTATVRSTQAASKDAWLAAVESPGLGTLRVLRKGHASAVRYASLVLSPMARDLRRVDVDGPRMLEELAKRPPRRLEGIRLTCVDWDACLHLVGVSQFASVRAIDVPYLHPPLLEEFGRHGLCSRIEELGVATGNAYLGYRGAPVVGELGALGRRFPRLKRFVVAYEGDHPMVAFVREGESWTLRLRLPRRPEKYFFSDHGTIYSIDPDRPALWTPPPPVRRVHLCGYPSEEVREGLAERWALPVTTDAYRQPSALA